MWTSLLIAGKHGGECSMESDGLRAEGEFLAFIWLVSRTTGESRVRRTLVIWGCWISFLWVFSRSNLQKSRSDFNLNVPQSSLSPW